MRGWNEIIADRDEGAPGRVLRPCNRVRGGKTRDVRRCDSASNLADLYISLCTYINYTDDRTTCPKTTESQSSSENGNPALRIWKNKDAHAACASLVDLDDGLALRALEGDRVDLAHEREVLLLARRLDAGHHVLGSARALQLLAVELLRLDHVPRLGRSLLLALGEDVGALAVAPAEARRDLVRAGLG